MSFRKGGAYGLKKAMESKNTCTAVYSSGLQITGTFTEFKTSENGDVTFIKTTGPSALAVNNKQLKGHGKDYHKDGFSSPVGKLKGYATPPEDFNAEELGSLGLEQGKQTALHFENGISVSGVVKAIISNNDKIQLITFTGCTVLDSDHNILFDPSWGTYDMAVGEKITSVFCGAADKESFVEIPYRSTTATHHARYDYRTLELHKLYQQVRDRRHNGGDFGFLGNVWHMLQKQHQDDWLCALEILEVLDHEGAEPAVAREIRTFLEQKAGNQPDCKKLITDGLYLINHPVEQKLVV